MVDYEETNFNRAELRIVIKILFLTVVRNSTL